ncbi:MAG: dockerin type I domain-containing protein [bacterium]|nr:dockerin type I domain-containing protein [bacterium]
MVIVLFNLPAYAIDLGDANGDGAVNIDDALLIARYLVGIEPVIPQPNYADVNGNDRIDIVDAMIIAQFHYGLRAEIPKRLMAIPGANPTSGPAPLTVNFTTDGKDPKGTIQVYRWDFEGDGNWGNMGDVVKKRKKSP